MTEVDGTFKALFGSGPPPADPYPLYEQLRAAGRPVRLRNGVTLALDYDDCTTVLRDPRFVNDPENVGIAKGGIDWRSHACLRLLASMLVMANERRHQALRRIVTPAFGPEGAEGLRGRIAHLIGPLLAEFAASGGGASWRRSPTSCRCT